MEKATLFIGSSREGLEIARAISHSLRDEAEVTVWNEGVFATMPNAARRFPPGVMTLSEAVLSRQSAVVLAAPGATPARYAPDNVPELIPSA